MSADYDIKLIALDMDGTLLNEEGCLSLSSRQILERVMDEGIHVVISTGRVFSALPQDVLDVDGMEYAITSNGANILKLADQTTVYSNLIGKDSIIDILPYIQDEDVMIEAFFDHDVVAERRCLENLARYGMVTEKSQIYTLSTRKPVENIASVMEEKADRMENINLIFSDQKKRMEFWNFLSRIPSITVTSSMPYNLEIGGATTSKADALKHLCSLLDVKHNQVMACGDSENDLAMLQFAGLSVAMENAAAPLKKIAHFITKTNREDGVAHAIQRFVLDHRQCANQ
ncbi:MAG: HAD family hydrolase [Anaerovorax sp.]|nr:HAD family hydrolase [Anaerovorax sp.]